MKARFGEGENVGERRSKVPLASHRERGRYERRTGEQPERGHSHAAEA